LSLLTGACRSLAAVALLTVAACKGNSGQPTGPTGTAPTDIAAQFEQMWTTFDRNYSYFDDKRIDWNALKAEFAPRVAGLTQNEFVLLVQNMLGRLHDQHVVLTSGNTTLRTSARRRIPQFLTHQLRSIGVGLGPELLYATIEDFGEIQVAVLIHRDRMRAIELTRLAAGDTPPIQILSVQIVLDDPVRPAVRLPEELIRGDQVRIGL
jgi:hypothetical protein